MPNPIVLDSDSPVKNVHPPKGIYDLLYLGELSLYHEIEQLVRDTLPDATTENGSDYIHPCRLVVKSDTLDEETYLLWVLKQGLFEASFHWQMLSMSKEAHDYAHQLIKRAVAEKKAAADAHARQQKGGA